MPLTVKLPCWDHTGHFQNLSPQYKSPPLLLQPFSTYLLSKTHKPNNIYCPIVSSFNFPTKHVSANVIPTSNLLFKPYHSTLKTPIIALKSSIPFLAPFSVTLMVALDLIFLHTNILHATCPWHLCPRKVPIPSSPNFQLSILFLLSLTHTNFSFNSPHFLQVKSIAIEIYENLFSGSLEEDFKMQTLCCIGYFLEYRW